MQKFIVRAAIVAAAAVAITGSTMGVASATTGSATFAGFGSGPTETYAENTALVNVRNNATNAGYDVTTQCREIGRSEEYNGSTAYVEIDLGCGPAYVPTGATVPSVRGTGQFYAEQAITGAGLTYSESFHNDCIDPGTVESQNPAGGTVVNPGTNVSITISTCSGGGLPL